MISAFFARGIILVFGTLFPAYYSYKAVKTKNVKEYVKWMMYWIVFAFFTCFETLTDLFLAFWFPFYYELKILLVLWLLSPATRGSSVMYRKFVHPWLTQRESDIDEYIAKAKQQGYSTVLQLGTKGVNYATAVIMQTAIKGGGGLVNQLKRSYSVGELAEDAEQHGDVNRNVKALHDAPDYPHHSPPSHQAGTAAHDSRARGDGTAAHDKARDGGTAAHDRARDDGTTVHDSRARDDVTAAHDSRARDTTVHDRRARDDVTAQHAPQHTQQQYHSSHYHQPVSPDSNTAMILSEDQSSSDEVSVVPTKRRSNRNKTKTKGREARARLFSE